MGSKLLMAQYVALLNGHNNPANHAPGVQIGNGPVCSNVKWSQIGNGPVCSNVKWSQLSCQPRPWGPNLQWPSM